MYFKVNDYKRASNFAMEKKVAFWYDCHMKQGIKFCYSEAENVGFFSVATKITFMNEKKYVLTSEENDEVKNGIKWCKKSFCLDSTAKYVQNLW